MFHWVFLQDNSSVIGINDETCGDIECTSERAFERLSNLQFLRIHGDGINPRSMNHISQKLRVLCWSSFQMTCFPSSFNPKFLVKLEMQFSDLEKLWDEIRVSNTLFSEITVQIRLSNRTVLLCV